MSGSKINGVAGTLTPTDGCQGGNAVFAWMNQLKNKGFAPRMCNPYTGQGYQQHSCGTTSCDNPVKYQPGKAIKMLKGANAMQQELAAHGALVASVYVTKAFYAYRSGVFSSKSGSNEGGHSFALMGYGTADGKKYWLFGNSWGADWGEGGYGRMLRGANLLKIEQEPAFSVDIDTSGTPCAGKPPCLNGGSFTSSCGCTCEAPWAGDNCQRCEQTCQNGGNLQRLSCQCDCSSGTFGSSCEDYFHAAWQTLDLAAKKAYVAVSWRLSSKWKGKAFVSRYTGFPVTTVIDGTQEEITSPEGSLVRELFLEDILPGSTRAAYYYAVKVWLGQNEFGASLGYTYVEASMLEYDDTKGCVFGGNEGADVAWCTKLPQPPPLVPPQAPRTPSCADTNLETDPKKSCARVKQVGLCTMRLSDGARGEWELKQRNQCKKTCGLCAASPAQRTGTSDPLCGGRTKFIKQCGACVSSSQCIQGYCCPFMKKCIQTGDRCPAGSTGWAECRPRCSSAVGQYCRP